MQRLTVLKDKLSRWEAMSEHLAELADMVELADDDDSFLTEIAAQVEAAAKDLDKRELELMLDRPYADHNAVITITTGAGGVSMRRTGPRC